MAEPGGSRRPEHLQSALALDQGPDAGRLLSAVAAGDDESFARLYDLITPRVYGLIRRVLSDPAKTEEVAQEVLVEVWRTAARFDPARGSATSWIFTIAHRRAVDRVRSEQAAVGLRREADRTGRTGRAVVVAVFRRRSEGFTQTLPHLRAAVDPCTGQRRGRRRFGQGTSAQ